MAMKRSKVITQIRLLPASLIDGGNVWVSATPDHFHLAKMLNFISDCGLTKINLAF